MKPHYYVIAVLCSILIAWALHNSFTSTAIPQEREGMVRQPAFAPRFALGGGQ